MEKQIVILLVVLSSFCGWAGGVWAGEPTLEEPEFAICPAGYRFIAHMGGSDANGLLLANNDPWFRIHPCLVAKKSLSLFCIWGQGHG